MFRSILRVALLVGAVLSRGGSGQRLATASKIQSHPASEHPLRTRPDQLFYDRTIRRIRGFRQSGEGEVYLWHRRFTGRKAGG
jgi:hypothetical protein